MEPAYEPLGVGREVAGVEVPTRPRIFAEVGVRIDHAALARAPDFLEAHAIVDGGMSLDGRRDGLLACRTGIVAGTLLRAGRADSPAGPLHWIITSRA
jgi:hypothetical protein